MKNIFVLLLCLLILLSAVSCATPITDKESEDTNQQTDAPDIIEKPQYKDIIDKYKELLYTKKQNEVLAEPKDSANEIEVALYEIVNDCTSPSIMGYATKDINDDGVEELILLNKSNKIYALFTLQGGAPVLLLKADKMSVAITPDGTVYAHRYIKDQAQCTQIKKISDGKLKGLEYGSVMNEDIVTYYKSENGVKTDISKQEKLQLDQSVQSVMINPMYQTKTTGFRFVAAVSEISSNTAPIPNFTSYDGIISAYKTIVKSFSEYEQLEWTNGKFDNLFTITDNDSYDVFHQIFWGGIRKMPTETSFGQTYANDGDNSYGYAKKDLNGDGVEELILLNDNYEIFALFTEKGEKAQLVDGAYGAWVDENGRIYKEISTGGLVGRDGEGYVYVLDGSALKTEIAVGYRVNIYLQKEGWYKIEDGAKVDISAEEGEALYAEVDIIPPRYSADEYTRSFSGIEFTPLFESTLASQKHLNTFSNLCFVNGDTLTVSAVSNNDVTVDIKFVHTVGEYDFETNTEPEVYITNLETKAIRNGNIYEFEKDGIKGYIEFAVNSAWVIVTESENEHVTCRLYLFDYPED